MDSFEPFDIFRLIATQMLKSGHLSGEMIATRGKIGNFTSVFGQIGTLVHVVLGATVSRI